MVKPLHRQSRCVAGGGCQQASISIASVSVPLSVQYPIRVTHSHRIEASISPLQLTSRLIAFTHLKHQHHRQDVVSDLRTKRVPRHHRCRRRRCSCRQESLRLSMAEMHEDLGHTYGLLPQPSSYVHGKASIYPTSCVYHRPRQRTRCSQEVCLASIRLARSKQDSSKQDFNDHSYSTKPCPRYR